MRSVSLFIYFCMLPGVIFADNRWERSSIELVQTKLNELGYTAGPVDGKWGKKTSAAVLLYCEEYAHDCAGGVESVINFLKTDTDDSYLDARMDLASAVWFENRIGFGSPKHRIERYVNRSRRDVIELVVSELTEHTDKFEMPNWFSQTKPLGKILQTEAGKSCDNGYLKNSLQTAWISSVFKSDVPQFDRLATFWLDHFSVGYDDYEHPHAYARHLNFVRHWREGNFIDLLSSALSDPSIIVYLNNDQSDAGAPNENLAREFFELFALGEGNYTEADVRQFSKLITGRAFNLAEEQYQFMKERSDNSSATVFKVKFKSVDSLVKSIENHPAYGNYIIKKLYQEFISLSEPKSYEIRRFKKNFINNKSNIIRLFEDLISSKSFWDLDRQLSLVKSPLELIAGAGRSLNSGGSFQIDHRYWSRIEHELEELRQPIFDPSSIDGWPVGKEWVQGQTLDLRTSILQDLYFSQMSVENITPPFQEMELSRYWKTSDAHKERIEAQEKFYLSARKDQLMIGDIIADFDEFDPDRYWVLTLIFKNVRFNDKHYDQIALYFNHAVGNDPPHDRHIKFFRETNSNSFMRDAKFASDGNTVWFGTPVPFDRNDNSYNSLKSYEKKMVNGLVSAASIFFIDPNRVGQLDKGGREWLKNILDKDGLLTDVYDRNSSVRLFGGKTMGFKDQKRQPLAQKSLNLELEFDRVSFNFHFHQPRWLTIETVFRNIDIQKHGASRKAFSLGFDSNIERGTFHALRLGPRSFQIPSELSYQGQPGYFYVNRGSAEDGSFRRLFNSLSGPDQIILRKACEAISENKMINEMLDNIKVNSQLVLLPQDRRDYFEVINHAPVIKELAQHCVEISSRVYVSDLKNHLELLGYNIGNTGPDIWDADSQKGLDAFLSENGLQQSTIISANLFDLIRSKFNGNAPSLDNTSNSLAYFNKDGEIKKSSNACSFEVHKAISVLDDFFTYKQKETMLATTSAEAKAKVFSKLWFGRPSFGEPGFIADLSPNAVGLTDARNISDSITSVEFNLK